MRRSLPPLPEFPIEPVLLELGAESVPTGFGWVKMHCPFHPDRTMSASVNHEINGFRCMACGVSGDSLKLLQDQLGLEFKDALERAKNITHVEVGKVRGKPRRRSSLLDFSRDY